MTTGTAISDDYQLLRMMLSDASAQRDTYKPGPYWRRKSKNAANQIALHGLADFRGATSTIGQSYADSVILDVRHSLTGGLREPLRFLLESVFPFKGQFDSQVSLTTSYCNEARRLRRLLLNDNPRVHELLRKYAMPPSLEGGCLEYVEVNGEKIATLYLMLLHEHDLVAEQVDFSTVRSFFEIGGGFGTNVHLLLENYPNIRKVVYLDIPPNLYVGTQYLKSIYGDSIRDYRESRTLHRIQFSTDKEREILAIAPWQIERLDLGVDVFYNAHSFVEMPRFIVANYADHLAKLARFESTAVVMLSYDAFDLSTTFHPDLLPGFFPSRRFDRSTFPALDGSDTRILFTSLH